MVSNYKIVPLLALTTAKIQEYFQVLYMHDTLKYRFADIDEPQWADVIDVIKRMGKQMYFVTNEEGILAEFTLEGFTGKSAQVHFSFHPTALSTKEKLGVGKFTLDQIFNHWKNPETDEAYLDSLYGLTPTPNRVACIFALKAGFNKLGVLPSGMRYRGAIVDAMVSIADRSSI